MAASDTASTLETYYKTLRSDIYERLSASEEGGTQEQTFTQYAIDLLAEAGEVENARECYDEKNDRGGRHKINGYSLSENLETVQLFYTVYKSTDTVSKIYKADIDRAVAGSTRFLKNALNRYFEEMEVTAPAFDFARELGTHNNDIERAEIFILTDGECDVSKPADDKIREVLVMYRIIDLRYLMQLESGQPDPIEIDFEELCGQSIPCLTVPDADAGYESYLAVVPGTMLADVYKRYGARLLEMNVRSFLQFTGKINKGIRETIKTEPHMFLAFNNGIAATAESVELVDLPQGGKGIKSIREFQIVNGGQTTASILHTRQKDKADVDRVFVQMKLSVIKNRDEVSTIVNRISRYANSQNKVSDADLSANSPFHIEMEKLSRYMWAAPQPGVGYQTRWFYERARGQYKNELAKQITPKQKNTFLAQTPRNQLLVKEDLAKYVNLWAMLPYNVVRGNQKNYVVFMASLKKRELKPDSVFFEDLIAKAVLFRAAEKIYGVKPNALGDLRYIIVPYTIAYLNQATAGRLDLSRIWKRQMLSESLKSQLRNLMIQVENFIKSKAPGSLYAEWAKKEECWQQVSKQKFAIDLNALAADLVRPGSNIKRQALTDADVDTIATTQTEGYLRGISTGIWQAIDSWGSMAENLSLRKRTIIQNVVAKIKSGRTFTDSESQNGLEIIDIVLENAPHLFTEDEVVHQVSERITEQSLKLTETQVIMAVLVVQPETWFKLSQWAKRYEKLTPFDRSLSFSMWKLMERSGTPSIKQATQALRIIQTAEAQGFTP